MDVHPTTELYDIEAFKKHQNSLTVIEQEELSDVRGKSMLHLQCHFGQDTLSWAVKGAKMTAIDLSDKAIDYAQNLSDELNIPARFVCCNVYDTRKHIQEKFDIVFTSYGTIGWLPDLDLWAKVVADSLKPGGTFYIVEFHPLIWTLSQEDWKSIGYSYFNDEVIEEINEGTYADRNAPIRHTEYSWNHPTSELLNALIKQGIQIEHFNEFPFSTYNVFPNMEKIGEGKYVFKHLKGMVPYLFSIKGRR